MYSVVNAAVIKGIESIPVQVEADVSEGMPVFEMVGFLSAEVKEAKERVRIALKNSGFALPPKRITINLTPADIKKSGTAFDLPIAFALLCAMKVLPTDIFKQTMAAGEIGLNGNILPIRGMLPIVEMARKMGMKKCLVPDGNQKEASLISGIEIVPLCNIENSIKLLKGDQNIAAFPEKKTERSEPEKNTVDFSEINGQEVLKRACEIAVSGMHNLLMIGPPGAGKTMAAKRIPTILPPLNEKEQMELSKIYSVCGLLDPAGGLLNDRPCRMPHHTITPQALAGGGVSPKPGEISLAHAGVLFLDELPEFKKATLEILRQPLEDKQIRLVRMSGIFEFPSDFILVAAMNPCKCGFYPDRNKCRCSDLSIRRYLSGISQPLLDRIDICVEAPRLAYEELTKSKKNESSAEIRARVLAAQQIQKERYNEEEFDYNAQIPSSKIKKYCKLTPKLQEYMKRIFLRLDLSARAYYKILKVARTIADLEQSTEIKSAHLTEAVCYRSIDKKFWENDAYDL
ncbi:MAG: YifB family Mg chelatase-like AAA ATPase [Eubacterium sp.]|nr:YifB family Mg chelatase-like AAA ATPase [Eubacterium sp.]